LVAKDFPCKTCRHAAIKHFTNISENYGVCTDCASNDRTVQDREQFHDFVGDNLAFMELKKKKQELLNE
jgi:protein-arginine kinase activator protein McsA